ncbi:MAG: ABC transporter permease [Opitutaceae bacterium]|nr:ABC transporter permease [Opitutaceae bacterium]
MLAPSLHALRRRPGLSAGIVATLGLALAATLLVLGLLNSYLLRPLPFGDAERLVAINEYPLATGPGSLWRMTFGNAADVHDQVTAFSRTAIVRNEAFTVRAGGAAEVAFIQRVTPEFFGLLGQRALLGDVITPANAATGGQRAVVLSHEFWQRRFGGDPDVIGETLALEQTSGRIVGVLPPETVLPLIGEGQQGWVAMLPADFQRAERLTRRHFMFGELAPGRTVASARAELAALARTLARDHPATNADRGLTAVGLRDVLVGNFRRQLVLLQAAVALVLVVACVNAACLLLAQAIRRRREFAVRLALGAATRDLLRQFFLESLWLALGGAAVGLALAAWLAPLTTGLLPAASPLRQLPAPGVSGPVVLAALGLAVAIAFVFSLVPLLQARRLNLEATLRDGSRQPGSAASGAATRVLVSVQVAVALALLIAAVQLVRSFRAVQDVDHGIPAEQIYSFRTGTRGAQYDDPAARIRYFERVVAELRALPHVAAAATADFAFANAPDSYFGFTQEGDGLALGETPKRAARRAVSPGLRETLQLRLHAGRWLHEDDRADTPRVAVISQSLADQYWPGQDPVGRRVRIENTGEDWWQVVGVVSDILGHGSQPRVVHSFFLPYTQLPPADSGVFVRTRGAQRLTREQADRAVSAADLQASAYLHQHAAAFYAQSAWQTRFGLTLVGAFAGLAVALCLTGVYAVLAFAVAGRTAEFGVRLALGASRADVARLVLRDALRLTGPGLLGGVVLAALSAPATGHLLYGVAPVDAATYAAALTALAAACLAACVVPARRATRIDPLVALRTE